MKLVQGGIDMLFEQHSIKEIQEIEQTIRADIERKKEELRQMVGERYRDLIEAADTIAKMKETSENVQKTISSLTAHCENLQRACGDSSGKPPLPATSGESVKHTCYAILAQVKVLVNAPAKLWSLLEECRYMACGALFLLARQTHAHLQLGHVGRTRRLLDPWRVLIDRQWASLSCFRSTILQTCWKTLQSLDVTSELAVECICCVVLLEDCTLDAAFASFLDRRLDVVKDIFGSGKQGSTTREQLCHLAGLVVSTFRLVHSLFLPASREQPSTVEAELRKATLPASFDLVGELDDPGDVSSRYLPQEIREYSMKLSTEPKSMDPSKIQEELRTFLSRLEAESESHVVSELKHLQSSKAVIQAGISVQELSAEQEKLSPSWDVVCEDLLGEKFSVWSGLLRDKCVDRIKVIVGLQMERAVGSCLEALVKTKTKAEKNGTSPLEQDAATFTWSGPILDRFPSKGIGSRRGRKPWETGVLGAKARGHTPQVQGICGMLDKQLKAILQDLEALAPDGPSSEEKQAVSAHVHAGASAILRKFLDFVEAELGSSSPDGDWFALLGKVCYGFADLAPHLQQCFPVCSKRNPASKGTQDTLPWQQERNSLVAHRDSAYKACLSVIIEKQLQPFRERMTAGSLDSFLRSLLEWSEVEIQEETEGGSKVKSTIRLPHHMSVYVQELLLGICEEINRVFGHSLSREALLDADGKILEKAQPIFEESIRLAAENNPAPVAQTWALQLLLDVRVMGELLRSGRSDEVVASIRKALELHIDPFDLDVFAPHLDRHVEHVVYQSSLLLGLIASPNRLHCERPPPSATAVPNILPMHVTTARFPLLPTASRFLDRDSDEPPASQAPAEAPGKLLPPEFDVPKEAPSLTTSRSSPSLGVSPSFYEKMATTMRSSWFGGQ